MEMSKRHPILFIQCDWNDTLRLPCSEAWISAKYRSEIGIHGKIKSVSLTTDEKPKYTTTDQFKIQSHTSNTLVVRFPESDLVTAFVAPMKAYNIHKKAVHSVSAAENAFVVSTSEDDKITVWDSRTGEELLSLEGHGGPAYKCKFFPSGLVVLTAGADGSLRVWSAENGVCPVTLSGHKMAVLDMAIVDKGRNVVSVSKDGTAKIWDVGESKSLGDVISANGIISCCCLVETSNAEVVENHREVGTGNKLIVVGCESGMVYCAHLALRRSVYTVKMDSAVNCCASSTDGILVGLADGKVVLISIEDGSTLKEWWESASPILSLACLPNSKFLVGCQDGTCIMYSMLPQYENLRVQLTGSDCDPIRDISFNGRWVFTACRDSLIRKYDYNQLTVHFK